MTKDSFEWPVWVRVQVVFTSLHFSHKTQPQTRSHVMGMSNILCLLSSALPLGEGGRRDTAERDEVLTVLPVHEGTQSKLCVKAWTASCWKLLWALWETCRKGKNCPFLSSTTFVQHLTVSLCNLDLHMLSHQHTQCYRHHSSSPSQECPFISLRHVVISADSCCFILVWLPYAQHFQNSVCVCSTDRKSTIFATFHGQCSLNTVLLELA